MAKGEVMNKLYLYQIGPDIVSAESPNDAKEWLKKNIGYTDEDLQDEELIVMGEWEEITVSWMDGDFEDSKRGVDYPNKSTVEFVALYLSPHEGSVPRFELNQVSFKDGYIRVKAVASEWATLGKGLISSTEY
jgi:hypothetical protein